jgi:hypothetical protein
MTKKNQFAIATAGILAGAAAMWVTLSLRNAPDLASQIVVESPPWMKPKAALAAETRVDVTPPPPEPTVEAEMAKATNLAGALQEAKTPITYTVSSLVDSGLAQEIVDGMTRLMEQQAPVMRWTIKTEPTSDARYLNEFLFAVWPDLGSLIASGKVKPHVVRIPDNSRVPRQIVFLFKKKEDKTEFVFNTENGWQVSLAFTPESNPLPELYKQLVASKYQETPR